MTRDNAHGPDRHRAVVGMAQAAMAAARLIGERFAIVTISPELTHWYEDCVAQSGHCARCTGVFLPDTPVARVESVAEDMQDALLACAHEPALSGAVLILAGAHLACLAAQLAPRINAPVVDPISAAVLMAETLVRLGGRSTTDPARNAGRGSTGLPAALAGALSPDIPPSPRLHAKKWVDP